MSSRLALAFYEDGMALASWLAAQGFEEDAANVRQAAIKLRPMASRRMAVAS